MMRGHRKNCPCVGCSAATRAKGMRAARRNPRRELSGRRVSGTFVTVAPSPAERIAALRSILTRKQYAKIDGHMVDTFSASAILSVFDALGAENQARYAAMPVGKMASIAFKLHAKRNPRRKRPSLGAPIYQTRERIPKYTGALAPLGALDATAAGRMLRRRFAASGWTKADHEAAARELVARAKGIRSHYHALIARAEKQYGDYGPLVSGVIREHFPTATKTRLRSLAHDLTRTLDAAGAHWRAAGRRTSLRLGNPRGKKPPKYLRDMEHPTVLGYELDRKTLWSKILKKRAASLQIRAKNPPGRPARICVHTPRVVTTLPATNIIVRYRRTGKHPGLYEHKFAPGVKVQGMSDGSVRISGAKPAFLRQ
jgi:hypothetical protein